uniref:Uncharacterized protein n=1 Tax=Arundo donax TaxID=35708 RepID=A0A0A9E2Q5_ARUDO
MKHHDSPSITVQPQGHECPAVKYGRVNQLWQPTYHLGRA